MTSSQVAFTSGMDDADAAGETGIDGATGALGADDLRPSPSASSEVAEVDDEAGQSSEVNRPAAEGGEDAVTTKALEPTLSVADPPKAVSARARKGMRPGARTRHSIREKGSTMIKLRSCRCCADDEAAAFAHSME
ncbi:unnamed protein product [Cladocopium goreaui]|uniref:Uncharacterized protein n=1 Tax=Cladocopium goreaui TaxID=2562237 RepID=A0A9P1CHF9_9DINO|nr:unnamed protein product [Cladocopium goreaui]